MSLSPAQDQPSLALQALPPSTFPKFLTSHPKSPQEKPEAQARTVSALVLQQRASTRAVLANALPASSILLSRCPPLPLEARHSQTPHSQVRELWAWAAAVRV